ncbi:MAG: hypothetical protein JW888_17820 [Pirellulales bacterium]|nr:hypothetical protein [Pirellulales bacterium]
MSKDSSQQRGVDSYVFSERTPPESHKTSPFLPPLPPGCVDLLEILDAAGGYAVETHVVMGQTTREALDFCGFHGLYRSFSAKSFAAIGREDPEPDRGERQLMIPCLHITPKGRACLAQHRLTTTPDGGAKPLTESQRDMLIYITTEGPVMGKAIAGHFGISESTVTRHYIRALRPHGVKNRRGAGYYVDPPT